MILVVSVWVPCPCMGYVYVKDCSLCRSHVISRLYFNIQPAMDRWFYLQDTCGVHNLHGLPGVFSGLASALVASAAEEIGGKNKAMYGNR